MYISETAQRIKEHWLGLHPSSNLFQVPQQESRTGNLSAYSRQILLPNINFIIEQAFIMQQLASLTASKTK